MSDSPEETARRRKLLKELWQLQNEIGIPEDQLTFDSSDSKNYLYTDEEKDAYAWGVKDEREAIVSQLKEYVEDRRLCRKKDSCADIAYAIQGQIEEITGEEMQDSYPAERVTEIENEAYEVGKTTGLREGNGEGFVEGMAEAHDVVWSTIDRLQQSLNDVMGIYMDMPQDIKRENPEVKELSAMHAVLSQFREMFVDNYDEAMREHKASKAWREDTDQLKSEWPE